MKVIKREPVPVYEAQCPECNSVLQYRKNEVSNKHITCPVCGISMWASATPHKIGYEDTEESNDE